LSQSRKEQIVQEQNKILQKYGYVQSNHCKAFSKMCDGKDAKSKEATSDYERFIELGSEYVSINMELLPEDRRREIWCQSPS